MASELDEELPPRWSLQEMLATIFWCALAFAVVRVLPPRFRPPVGLAFGWLWTCGFYFRREKRRALFVLVVVAAGWTLLTATVLRFSPQGGDPRVWAVGIAAGLVLSLFGSFIVAFDSPAS